MLAVNGFIHGAHVFSGDLAGERIERILNLRPALQRVLPYQWNGLVRRKIMAIIFESPESEGLNRPVRRVAGNHVYLMRIERAIEQPQVHRSRGRCKLESIGLAQAR